MNGAVGFGVFSLDGDEPRVGFRVGGGILDLTASGRDAVFSQPSLNAFLAAGRRAWEGALGRVAELVESGHEVVSLDEATVHLPFRVGDYVDFYSSLEHATNLGRLFRPDADPLLPNWRHLPVGYHGRAGSVVVGGTPVVRPCGQAKGPDDPEPRFGPSRKLDIELELGFVVGIGSTLGVPVPASDFREHVFGVVLVNDWSARDIQAWEYQPLGPFLGKSFATSISAWVTPLALLEDRFVVAAGTGARAAPLLARARELGARHRARGRAVRNDRLEDELPLSLLDDAAATGARDRERRIAPDRRSVRVGDDLRPGSGKRGLADRADP